MSNPPNPLTAAALDEVERDAKKHCNDYFATIRKEDVFRLIQQARRCLEMEEAARAFQALNVVYRLGSRPSVKLLKRCNKARKLLQEEPKR